MSETPEQRAARIQEEGSASLRWLDKKWPMPRLCPICGQNNWGIGSVMEVRQFEGGNLVLGGNSGLMPLFPVTCDNCAYTFFMNALKAGVVQAPQGESNE